jgi:hypothetical protein
LINTSKNSIENLKHQTERIHEGYLKSEDDFIDRLQNPSTRTLTHTLSSQIDWLKQLQHLKIWYSLLSDVQQRAESILNNTKNEESEERIETVSNELIRLVNLYRSFKGIEFETQSKLNLLELIQQVINHTIQLIIQVFSRFFKQPHLFYLFCL